MAPDFKRCKRCEEDKPLSEFSPHAQCRLGVRPSCRSCENDLKAGTRAAGLKRYRADNRERYLWSAAKARAERAGLPFDITPADIVIPATCPVLGIPISPPGGGRTDGSPSVDRIVPERGYTRGNIVVTSWRANHLKNNATLTEMERLVSYYRRRVIPRGRQSVRTTT